MGFGRVKHTSKGNKGIFYSILSGLLLGSVPIFIKNALVFSVLTAGFFLSPYTWLAAIAGLLGFFLMQKALYSWYVSTSIAVITGLSIAVPVLIGLFFSQAISFTTAGIFVIVLGVLVIGFGACKK